MYPTQISSVVVGLSLIFKNQSFSLPVRLSVCLAVCLSRKLLNLFKVELLFLQTSQPVTLLHGYKSFVN